MLLKLTTYNMKHCYGCKIEKEEYLKQLSNQNRISKLLDNKFKPFHGNYCYDCVLKRKREREHITLGKDSLKTITCYFCNKLFEQKSYNQKYCCKQCYNKQLWCDTKEKQSKRKCLYCNKDLNVSFKYCNSVCQYRYKHPPNPRLKHFKNNCLLCATPCNTKKFCSRRCLKLYKTVNQKPKDKTIIVRECKLCKTFFETLNKCRYYCSKYCSKKSITIKRILCSKDKKRQIKQRTPVWANKEMIEQIYYNRKKGYQVDHIIPLNGQNVCGLHVEYNLQYLTDKENNIKGNLNDGTYDNNGWRLKLL